MKKPLICGFVGVLMFLAQSGFCFALKDAPGLDEMNEVSLAGDLIEAFRNEDFYTAEILMDSCVDIGENVITENGKQNALSVALDSQNENLLNFLVRYGQKKRHCPNPNTNDVIRYFGNRNMLEALARNPQSVLILNEALKPSGYALLDISQQAELFDIMEKGYFDYVSNSDDEPSYDKVLFWLRDSLVSQLRGVESQPQWKRDMIRNIDICNSEKSEVTSQVCDELERAKLMILSDYSDVNPSDVQVHDEDTSFPGCD
jgi:hypothetical protein